VAVVVVDQELKTTAAADVQEMVEMELQEVLVLLQEAAEVQVELVVQQEEQQLVEQLDLEELDTLEVLLEVAEEMELAHLVITLLDKLVQVAQLDQLALAVEVLAVVQDQIQPTQ
jgi:hypothetical protein